MKLVLASTSVYRQALLKKIGINFECLAPQVDEERITSDLLAFHKRPSEIAAALAYEKAIDVSRRLQNSNAADKASGRESSGYLVIGGDQLVSFKGNILGKPGSFEKAFKQLKLMQNNDHKLVTCVCLVLPNEVVIPYKHTTRLYMRALNDNEIANYLQADKPYDCAGSYKIEEKGISLFNKIEGDDYTAIQGLPMIWLCNQLKEHNYEFFTNT